MIFKISNIIILIGLSCALTAKDLKSVFFTKAEQNRVLKGEIITRMYLKYNTLGENTHLKINIPHTKYTKENYSKYEMITDEKAFIPYTLNKKTKLKLYNILTSPSKLQGIKYWSRRAGQVKTLVTKSHRINNPENDEPVPDRKYSIIKPKVVNYSLQKDNKFGELIFKSELYNEGNNFVIVNTVLDSIRFVCREKEFKYITFLIYDKRKKGFYYYSVNVLRVRTDMLLKGFGFLTLRPTSFSNRQRAATVHLAKMLGQNWYKKLNPWVEKKLKSGFYKHY